MLPSRARFRFAGPASVRPASILAQSMPVNLSSFFCLTHGVQFTAAYVAKLIATQHTQEEAHGTSHALAAPSDSSSVGGLRDVEHRISHVNWGRVECYLGDFCDILRHAIPSHGGYSKALARKGK